MTASMKKTEFVLNLLSTFYIPSQHKAVSMFMQNKNMKPGKVLNIHVCKLQVGTTNSKIELFSEIFFAVIFYAYEIVFNG